MPVHDWSKVDAGLFHHFHQAWTAELCKTLNSGLLPPGYSALIEGKITGAEPDLMAVAGRRPPVVPAPGGGLLVSQAPPEVFHVSAPAGDLAAYAARANRVAVRYKSRRMVALIEIVSPGNKDRKASVERLVRKAVDLLDRGVNLLLIDLFPPTAHDPNGLYQAIWDEIRDDPFTLPPGKPLVLAACVGSPRLTAYVNPIGVGDVLPPMPLFLETDTYVPTPLEPTYNLTWETYPAEFRDDVLHPELAPPADEAD